MGRVMYLGGLAWLWVTTSSKDLLVLSLRQAPEEFELEVRWVGDMAWS